MALHEIPDDGTPHAPAAGCDCGPARTPRGGRWVYVHADRAPDDVERGPDDASH